ncbi:hypothetical protein Tco_0371691 [Tanacetum coccineum]
MTPAQLRQYMRTYVKNQGPAVYTTGWTMAQVQKLSPEQLQEEFNKIQRAVAFTRGLKRDGSPMTNASLKKLKTGDVEVDVEAPSHVEVPSQEATVDDVEVPSNIASKAQQTASSLKTVGTKKKRLVSNYSRDKLQILWLLLFSDDTRSRRLMMTLKTLMVMFLIDEGRFSQSITKAGYVQQASALIRRLDESDPLTQHNPFIAITKEELASLRAQIDELVGNEKVWIKMPGSISWDKVDNPCPQSTPQVLPSFEVYTLPMIHPEEVEETIVIPIEVDPLDHMKLEDLGLNTNTHDLFLSSRGFPSVDEPEPQPLPNLPFLYVNLGDKRGTDSPINPYNSDESDPLTQHNPFIAITKEELASLRAQIDELVGNEKVWIKMPGSISWDKGFSSVDESEPQPLPNLPFLYVNLGDKRGTDPPINPYSLGSFRMKEITNGNLRAVIFEEKKIILLYRPWRRRQD